MFTNQADKDTWDTVKGASSSSWNVYIGLAIESKGGLKFSNLGAGACHGKLSLNSDHIPGDVREIFSKRMLLQSGATEHMADVYYSWLINESPWAPAFIEKDYAQCCKTGFRIAVDLPADFVASACVATRFMTEKYQPWTIARYPLYQKLLDNKVDPLWAFIMSNIYYTESKDVYRASMQNGHEMLPPWLSLEGLARFVKGEYQPGKTFKELRGYHTIGTTWETLGPEGKQIKRLAKNWPLKVSKKEDFNIFRRPDPNSGYPSLKFEEVLQVMEYLQENVYVEKVAA